MKTDSSKIIFNARKKILGLSQQGFASYLSDEKQINKRKITQSTVSKYENGRYEIPSDILMHCQMLVKDKYSNLEYSKKDIIEKVKIVDLKIHAHSLRAIGIILEQIT